MTLTDLLLLVLVAAGAFAAGYQIGRFKGLSERGGGYGEEDDEQAPLPGPRLDRTSQRGSPPPANAGADSGPSWSPSSMPPRRSTKPPPAAAGLMDKGDKSGKGSK